jgi:protease I
MAVSLESAPVAFLVSGAAARTELLHCWHAVLARNGEPVLVGTARSWPELHWQRGPRESGLTGVQLGGTAPAGYAGLVLIRGQDAAAAPASAAALAFIAGFFELGLPVAVSCYAGRDLVLADLVRGRTVTSAPSLRRQLAGAGAIWVDRLVAHCAAGPNSLVTSSTAASLPAFCDVFTKTFSGAGLAGQRSG